MPNPMHMERWPADTGFSLIEVGVGMAVAAVAVTMFVGAMGSSHRVSAVNREEQQAVGLAVKELEAARGLTWATLAQASYDPSAPLLEGSSSVLSAADTGIPSNESLVVASGGLVVPVTVTNLDGVTFTIWRYVSQSGYGADLRRVVVQVSWTAGGAARDTVLSTLIARVSTP